MTTFGIAAIQMDAPQGDNRGRMRQLVKETRERFPWVGLVMFSELSAFGNDLASAETLPGPAEQSFCEMAREFGVWLVPGSLFEQDGGKIYNTLSVIDPSGSVLLRYRKIYPWYPYENAISPGDTFKVFDIPRVGRFGVLICYDMMMPETTRQLAFLGAEVVLHPMMTTTLDRKQELVIAQANAIANQCYFLDVNGAGALGVGKSQIIGPEGEVIHLAGERQEIIAVRINLEHVRNTRKFGTAGTVQALKSFRDGAITFPAYEKGARSAFLDELGPLDIPRA
jgi:predicted amidohydrolase